jgi:hypothetical protein
MCCDTGTQVGGRHTCHLHGVTFDHHVDVRPVDPVEQQVSHGPAHQANTDTIGRFDHLPQ